MEGDSTVFTSAHKLVGALPPQDVTVKLGTAGGTQNREERTQKHFETTKTQKSSLTSPSLRFPAIEKCCILSNFD